MFDFYFLKDCVFVDFSIRVMSLHFINISPSFWLLYLICVCDVLFFSTQTIFKPQKNEAAVAFAGFTLLNHNIALQKWLIHLIMSNGRRRLQQVINLSSASTGMGIENRFQLRIGSNWLNPSPSLAFMPNSSPVDSCGVSVWTKSRIIQVFSVTVSDRWTDKRSVQSLQKRKLWVSLGR